MDTNVLYVQDGMACVFTDGRVAGQPSHHSFAYEGNERSVELLVMTLINAWLPASFFHLAKAAALMIGESLHHRLIPDSVWASERREALSAYVQP